MSHSYLNNTSLTLPSKGKAKPHIPKPNLLLSKASTKIIQSIQASNKFKKEHSSNSPHLKEISFFNPKLVKSLNSLASLKEQKNSSSNRIHSPLSFDEPISISKAPNYPPSCKKNSLNYSIEDKIFCNVKINIGKEKKCTQLIGSFSSDGSNRSRLALGGKREFSNSREKSFHLIMPSPSYSSQNVTSDIGCNKVALNKRTINVKKVPIASLNKSTRFGSKNNSFFIKVKSNQSNLKKDIKKKESSSHKATNKTSYTPINSLKNKIKPSMIPIKAEKIIPSSKEKEEQTKQSETKEMTIPLPKLFNIQPNCHSLLGMNQSNQNITHTTPNTSSGTSNTMRSSTLRKVSKIYFSSKAGYLSSGTEKINQDNFFITHHFLNEPEQYLLGVCDGHGARGDLVSEYIVNALPDKLLNQILYDKPQSDLISNILEAFSRLHHELIDHQEIDTRFSGTTCVSTIILKEKIICVNVGDSRAVLGKYEKGEWNAIELSRDHKATEPDERARILKRGGRIASYINEESKKCVGPERVWLKEATIPGLAMTRSLGDQIAHCVGVISEPEIKEFALTGGERFIVLASDGVWEFMGSNECVNLLKDYYTNDDIEGACQAIIDEAYKRWIKEQDIVDDITVVVAFFE